MEKIISGILGLGVGLALIAASGVLTRTWGVYAQQEWETGLSGRGMRALQIAVVLIGLTFIGLGISVMVRT